jgi:hypothetical protein
MLTVLDGLVKFGPVLRREEKLERNCSGHAQRGEAMGWYFQINQVWMLSFVTIWIHQSIADIKRCKRRADRFKKIR